MRRTLTARARRVPALMRWTPAAGCITAGLALLAGTAVSPAPVLAGFSNGSGPCGTGNGSYFGLTANACPFAYIPATTSVTDSYAPGQTFTFSVVVTNPTEQAISVPTDWGYHHILSILDSPSGAPTTRIDVSDGYTPAGYLPLTDANYFAYGMFRGAVETEPHQLSFTLTVPANSSVTVTETGSTTVCGYYELDLGGGGEALASGVIRVLGCTAPTPTPTATPTPTPTPTSTPTSTPTPTATATPTGSVLSQTPTPRPTVGTPNTGGGPPAAGTGALLTLAGMLLLAGTAVTRRKPAH